MSFVNIGGLYYGGFPIDWKCLSLLCQRDCCEDMENLLAILQMVKRVFTIIKHVDPDFSTVCSTVHMWTHWEEIVVCGKPNNFIILVGRGETITFFVELVLTLTCPRWCNSGMDDPLAVAYMWWVWDAWIYLGMAFAIVISLSSETLSWAAVVCTFGDTQGDLRLKLILTVVSYVIL